MIPVSNADFNFATAARRQSVGTATLVRISWAKAA
jgi:hypothetical protein